LENGTTRQHQLTRDILIQPAGVWCTEKGVLLIFRLACHLQPDSGHLFLIN